MLLRFEYGFDLRCFQVLSKCGVATQRCFSQLVHQWPRITVPLVLSDSSSQVVTLPVDTTVLSRDVLNPAHVAL